jgi:hypothetical protein
VITQLFGPTALAGLALGMCLLPQSVHAQAWGPAEGEGVVSVLYGNSLSDRHYLPTVRYDIGRIDGHSMLLDLTYGVSDRTAVSIALPLVVTRYRGDWPHPGTNTTERTDDGRWHSNWQDFRFSLRHNVVNGPVALTPFVGGIAPSHDYEYFAHAAAGRRLWGIQAGLAAAKLLDAIASGLFVQGRYSYSFVQRTINVRPNHSNADLELGYFITPSVRVIVLGNAQVSHGGIDVLPPALAVAVLTPEQRRHHDQIDRVNHLKLGVGASIDLTEQLGIFASYGRQVAGRNGHEIKRAISVGVSWSFGSKTSPDFAANQARLIRCACQKAGS